jgi:hypothetical protein
VWYWPDGTPGFRTPNEVPHTGWGMAQWLGALVEGLAGVRELEPGMAAVEVSPRWAAAGVDEAEVSVRPAAAGGYFSYRAKLDRRDRLVTIAFTGSGVRAHFRLLLPQGWMPDSLFIDGARGEAKAVTVGPSVYACFDAAVAGASTARMECQ